MGSPRLKTETRLNAMRLPGADLRPRLYSGLLNRCVACRVPAAEFGHAADAAAARLTVSGGSNFIGRVGANG
jgi:hypothetical protein